MKIQGGNTYDSLENAGDGTVREGGQAEREMRCDRHTQAGRDGCGLGPI
jgi:hypothetical protein